MDQTVKNKQKTAGNFLSPGEPAPFRVENRFGKGCGIVICDHAAHRVPKALAATFGVRKPNLLKHIGWDIGAEDAALQVGGKLDMPTVIASYSRLAVDLNRHPGDPESMTAESDHIAVPGNKNLTAVARQQRLDALFWPYHDAITAEIDRFLVMERVPLLIFIHSFTPEMDGFKRPWHIGILWNSDKKIAGLCMDALRKNCPHYVVGENEPYSLKNRKSEYFSVVHHAERRGLPHIFVEFRQDLVDSQKKAARWGNILVRALRPVMDDPATFRLRKPAG